MNTVDWMEAVSSLRTWEWCAAFLIVAAAFVIPARWERAFALPESLCKKLARRPLLSLLLVAAAPVLLRLALLPILGIPQPGVHDEFSYLLAADTFLHGRITNPTHPFWEFFESFHILQRPTYASMYPPAQGLFLAAGRLLAGHPWAGVLLSMAVLCASLLWMLRAWLPPEWALFGALLAVIRLGLFSYWANSYWGGAPGAIGGALVAGSLPRIFRRQRTSDAILLGLGLILLSASRPYEGFLFSIPFAAALTVWLLRGHGLRFRITRIAIPLAAILLAGGAAMAYYDWRITGHPFETPQLLDAHQYAAAGLMIWSKTPPTPVYYNDTMRQFYSVKMPMDAIKGNMVRPLLKSFYEKARVIFLFYLGPLLIVPLILAPAVFWGSQLRLPVLGIMCLCVGLACLDWSAQPHYFGPATGAVYALVTMAMLRVWNWSWRGRPCGHFVVRGLAVAAVGMLAIRIFAEPLGIDLSFQPPEWSATEPGNSNRATLASQLAREPDRLLVIVRYGRDHDAGQEWVYNEADIDRAKVVWARDLGPETDALVRYFHDRRVLVVEPEKSPLVTIPYEVATPGQAQ